MDGANLTLLQTGVWLIPVILLANLAGIVLLVRSWRTRSQEDIKSLSGRMRQFQGQISLLQAAAQEHTTDDPEPYGSMAAELHATLENLIKQITALQVERIALQERIHRLSANRWQSLVGAPYLWFGLRKDIAKLDSALVEAQDALAGAGEFEQNLSCIGWDIAQQARQARQIQVEVGKRMGELRALHVHGDTIEAATQQEEEARAALSQIPSYFLVADEASVLEQADKESVTWAHQTVQGIQPVLEALLSQASAWLEMYKKTSEKVSRMSQVVDEVENSLVSVPPEVQAGPIRAQLGPVKMVAQTLRQTLARLEIDNMDMVAQEAERVASSAREMEAQLRRAGEQQATLELVITEFSSELKQVSMQFASLGTRSTHPIVWGPSTAILTELNRGANEIGAAKKVRTPEQIEKDLSRAARLNTRQKELGAHCQSIEGMHQELISLLQGPQLAQMTQWLANAQGLTRQTSQYAPENWGRGANVASLPDEIEELSQMVRQLLPKSSRQTIQEGELQVRLEATRELAAARADLQKRVENIGSRLAEIQKSEKEAQENLKSAQAAFTQIAFVVRSNAFLAELAAQDLETLQAEIQKGLDQMADRQRGAVGKKERQVNNILGKAEQTANRWMDQLTQDTQGAVERISGALTALDAIATLDEAAIAEGRRLLSASQAYGAGGYGARSRFRLDELVAEFKRRSDYWQSCSAAASALADVSEPVLASFEEANYNRQGTQDLLARVSTWLQQTRDWPPTSVSLKDEQAELERLEGQWGALKSRRNKAINLVQQLGNLSAKYQTLAEKVNQNAERAEVEQAQVGEMELDINEAAQVWEQHWYSYREYPEISQEIRGLLDGIDHELAQIRRLYKQKSRNYQQVHQAMKTLYRQVRYYQVALDEDHSIDSSGQVITRR